MEYDAGAYPTAFQESHVIGLAKDTCWKRDVFSETFLIYYCYLANLWRNKRVVLQFGYSAKLLFKLDSPATLQ